MTAYIRYSQVRAGDRVKLEDGYIWRNRRTAEADPAPFLIVESLHFGGHDVELTTTDGQKFLKPLTSKALVHCSFCAPDEPCATHLSR